MPKEAIKAWAVVAENGKILEVVHGDKKEEIINYDICITKEEALRCKKHTKVIFYEHKTKR